jgi:hypothetical protein
MQHDLRGDTIRGARSPYRQVYIVAILILLYSIPLVSTAQVQGGFDILHGEKRVVLPFQFVNNFILVDLRLFGMLPMSFIFDTGAEHTILFKKEFADVFQVHYDLRIPIIGSDLSREVFALVVRSVDIELNGLHPVQRDILVLEEEYLSLDEITGRPIHGILGSSFFRNVIVQIDFRKRNIILHDPAYFHTPGEHYGVFDITVRSGKPYLHGSITLADATQVEVVLLVDTGAGLPLLLHNNTNAQLDLPDHHIVGRLGLGLGGVVEGYLGRIEALTIGDLHFPQMLTSFQDLSRSVLSDTIRFRNGLIGTQLLSRFHVYIDYLREKLYLRALPNYNRRFRMDKSGLIVFATGVKLNNYIVQDVVAQSPASDADIRPGDRILKLQGLPAEYFTLDDIQNLLQRREGKRVRMVIGRSKEILRKKITLRELI